MTSEVSSPDVWMTVYSALARSSRLFPADALALADAHREEIAPRLVAELEALAANPWRAGDDYMLHVYAMHLLAWWKDMRGLQPLLALARMRDHDLLDTLFGDHLTESLGRNLGSMARGDLQPLMALADDTGAYAWARYAALQAMKACVVEGDAQCDTVLAYVRDLAEREAAASRAGKTPTAGELDFMNLVVDIATDLGAADMLPAIRGWFDEALLDPKYADLLFIEKWISQPFAQCLQQMQERRDGYVADPEHELGKWACFAEETTSRGENARQTLEAFVPGHIDQTPPYQPYVRETPKVGRNEPCPCGSGKKYKKCHGAN